MIPKPLTAEEEVEEQRSGRRRPTADPTALHEAAQRFVDALSDNLAAAAELKRRGTLVPKLTGKGTKYLTFVKNAQRALRRWKLAKVCARSPVVLQLLRDHYVNPLLQSKGGYDLISDVRKEYERLDYLLYSCGIEIPQTTRTLLEVWRDAAWSIVSNGENDSLDGCWWLLHTENLCHALVVPTAAQPIRQAADALVKWCEAQSVDAPPKDQGGADDPSSWVPANQLWTEKFSSNKELTKFRRQHPEMFRNPSKFKLKIHAGLWARYWADRDKAGFKALDGDLPSVADDPNVQEDALAAATQRMASLRAKKKARKQ